MIGATVKIEMQHHRVQEAVDRGAYRGLGHAAASLRLIARRSIRTSKQPASAGSPPHTRRGLIRRAILFSVDKPAQEAVIGPAASIAGPSGDPHEHGGRFRGRTYDPRPFMGPALEAAAPRLPDNWANSVY